MARKTSWRKDISSINYLETSTWTQQEYNGFSHQNPSFIGAVLNLKPDTACNYINLMVGSKQPQSVFLTAEEADSHCQAGASVWKFVSTDNGLNPDVVLVSIGAEITFKVIEAAAMLRKQTPNLHRISIEAYAEEGSTITSFDMMLRNRVSQYHVMETAIKGRVQQNEKIQLDMHELLSGNQYEVSKMQEYIMTNARILKAPTICLRLMAKVQ
ncbi:MAG: phosphoketolase [Lasallia pustulata]|uniref:Phosphoketolase n=1 Tax=Lasallia pustulata TaxID=136370 RepID=A0A5M8PDL3_9LECA|nr:MAG: phosphoketolase [Lasallia pustulata]